MSDFGEDGVKLRKIPARGHLTTDCDSALLVNIPVGDLRLLQHEVPNNACEEGSEQQELGKGGECITFGMTSEPWWIELHSQQEP